MPAVLIAGIRLHGHGWCLWCPVGLIKLWRLEVLAAGATLELDEFVMCTHM
jgi:hypothetical protein